MRRRSLVYIAAWAAATSFGVAISWAGVRGVLTTAALAPPPAITVPSSTSSPPPSPTPSASDTPTSASPSPGRDAATTRPSKASRATRTPRPSDTGKVRSFTLRGGHVALAFYPHRIRLVSATPDPGWETNVWDDPGAGWLRVEFHRDRNSSAIFGVWHDGRPRVQFYDA